MLWVQVTGMMLILFGLPTLLLSFFAEIKREKPHWRRWGLGLVGCGLVLLTIGLIYAPETF